VFREAVDPRKTDLKKIEKETVEMLGEATE